MKIIFGAFLTLVPILFFYPFIWVISGLIARNLTVMHNNVLQP